MQNLAILILLTLFIFIWLRKKLNKKLINEYDYNRTKSEYDNLLSENKRIQEVNSRLQNTLDGTMALYDITKEICKSLDMDRVFGYFRQELDKYIKVSDCKFLKPQADLSAYKEYATFGLGIRQEPIGYLAAEGLKAEDKEKFYILSQQFLLGIKRAILYQEVQDLAITDSLTKVYNRRYYLERFQEEIERSEKLKYKFCCLMVDIDYFKTYNDRYGHIVGDVILKELANAIRENIRQIDLMGRYGGEEFSLVLGQTDKDAAVFAAERIRRAIEDKSVRAYDEELKITVSIGISGFPQDGQDIKTLIDKADSALYRAKEAGRNRVCVYSLQLKSL